MAQQGLCSRREADRYIEQGQVSVDGKIVSVLGTKILPDQKITLTHHAKQAQSNLVTVLINKPPGYVSGLPEKDYQSAVMLLIDKNAQIKGSTAPKRYGLAPAGRLDIDSTGLIIFTQDGRIARKLISPNSNIEKEYRICVQGKITTEKITLLHHGLSLDNKPLKPAKVKQIDENQLEIILREGRKRQLRRMCEKVDLKVVRLMRTRIGKIKLGQLQRGKWRFLLPDESFD